MPVQPGTTQEMSVTNAHTRSTCCYSNIRGRLAFAFLSYARLNCPVSHSYLREKPSSYGKASSRNHLPNPLHSSTTHRPHINISTLETISNFLQHVPTSNLDDNSLVNLKRPRDLRDTTCMERFQELSSCTSYWGRTSTKNFRL